MARCGVLLDVDGTLVDTNWLHVVAWSRALHRLGVAVPHHLLHRHIGMGSDRFVPAVAGREVEGASEAWTEEFDRLLDDIQPLPGARDLCVALRQRGLVVALASSAKGQHKGPFLRALELSEDDFEVVTTSDDAEESKPAPDIFATALAKADLDAAHAIVVGDTVWDVEAASEAGLACIGVLTGGIDRRDLEAAGAVAVYEGCDALLADLDRSPIRRLG